MPAEPGEVLPIVNVLGMVVDEPLVGRVEFELDGAPVSLLAIAGGDGALFVMFRDATSDAGETYGGVSAKLKSIQVAPPASGRGTSR